MENSAAKDPSSASGRSTSRLLRYPLRSATKSREEKPSVTESGNSASSSTRGKTASNVSKSVSILDFSGKDKGSKPPRRLSVPSRPNATPAPKSFGNITPISEARAKRSAGKIDTPLSDVSKSSNRAKFNVLSSASYWLSQIKHSESAAKHSISLGFFKLALEAGCEPMQRMTDELKSYVRRCTLSEHGELIKELFESYKISESVENSRVTETCSQVTAEGNQSSDDDVRSTSSSITDTDKLMKPKSPDTGADDVCKMKRNINTAEKNDSVRKSKRSVTKNPASIKSGSEVKGHNPQKKAKKPTKQESVQDKNKAKNHGVKSVNGEAPLKTPEEEAPQENKENMATPQMLEVTAAEA